MANPVKLLITSKKNLQIKYGSKFSPVNKLLSDLVKADKKRKLNTKVVYIDDATSATKAGITAVKSITRKRCKTAVDALNSKWHPVYIVLFGAQDVIPFQEIRNPAHDDDDVVPSDLPYACDATYSLRIAKFTGPSRVVGRIPDVPGQADLDYIKTVINAIIAHKPMPQEKLMDYFAVTADVWKKSTQQTLTSIFGNCTKLKNSPPAVTGYRASQLSTLAHFYNCHGSSIDSRYYGQKGNSYPIAIDSCDLDGKVSYGTVAAAECCYGSQLYNPDEAYNHELSVANTYLFNEAVSFVGSSTIAYGPADSMGLADLMTGYFMKNVLAGASAGRALLEARHKFLSVNGPYLDPYELKTLAQFYLLGDPSVQPVAGEVVEFGAESIENRRMKLFSKGLNLTENIMPSALIKAPKRKQVRAMTRELKRIFKEAAFTGKEAELTYGIKLKRRDLRAFAKGMLGGEEVTFRTFTKAPRRIKRKFNVGKVLVVKESGSQILGWRVYHRR